MLDRVVSGGQTGADQAGVRAARAAGIPTGGFAPKGWETEDGPAPWLADFGLVENGDAGYPSRTRANVIGADGTLWFGDDRSPGGRTTLSECRRRGKPFFVVAKGITRPSAVVAWIRSEGIRTLNIAGNRESTSPGIGARTEAFLGRVFARLRT